MGFWSKLGKIALQAAPYVAAPFTGGASLAAAPATRQIGQKWAASDAQKNAERGLGPSSFDRILGGISSGVGMASDMTGGFGMDKREKEERGGGGGWQDSLRNILGGGQQQPGQRMPGGQGRRPEEGIWERDPRGSQGGGWQDILGSILNRGQGQETTDRDPYSVRTLPFVEERTARPRVDPGMSRFGRQMRRQLGPVMGQEDQNNPNLALSIGAGRMEAIRNQPWRRGYDITTDLEETDEAGNPKTSTMRMPRIVPTGGNYERDMYRRRGRNRGRFSYGTQ